ncbi:MAG: hypothetical protein JKY22_11180 [Flavobacteriaceae bacterium]|nr:hypothetical protein [Flavobacteriaceae bacterium]
MSILVSVMVAIILLSFITLSHTHSFFRFKSENLLEQLERNEAVFFLDEIQNEAIFDSIELTKSFRGGFQLITAKSKFNNTYLIKIGLVGAIQNKQNTALYLQDNNNPLVMVGNAEIHGNVLLPANGVKAGVISGTYFNGNKLIRGDIKYSNSNLPALETNFDQYVQELRDISNINSDNSISLNSELKNSFKNSEKIIFDERQFTIYENAIGNIRFQSNKEIVISKEANLTDVLIVAPKIRIEKGFKGNIHLVAHDSIIIEKEVELKYPSSVIILHSINSEIDPAILIDKGSKVEGVVFFSNRIPTEKKETNILISEKAVVRGGLYCEGYVELYGTVFGEVYTSYFLTKASSGRYINHLMDGKIIANNESESFFHLPLKSSKKGVVQWMY